MIWNAQSRRYVAVTYNFCEPRAFEILGTYATQDEAKDRCRNLRKAWPRQPVAVIDTERERFVLNLRGKETL